MLELFFSPPTALFAVSPPRERGGGGGAPQGAGATTREEPDNPQDGAGARQRHGAVSPGRVARPTGAHRAVGRRPRARKKTGSEKTRKPENRARRNRAEWRGKRAQSAQYRL